MVEGKTLDNEADFSEKPKGTKMWKSYSSYRAHFEKFKCLDVVVYLKKTFDRH